MKRLRTMRFRHYVLPVILAALAARAFMPADSMSSADGTAIESQLCSLGNEGPGLVEFPGEEHTSPQCDHCLSPTGIAPIALLDAPSPIHIVQQLVRHLVSQVRLATVQRTQLARGPPHA